VLTIPADQSTCETQNSGQGVFNLVSAVALMPDGAPAEVANQLWVGGTQENAISKGLFKRDAGFKDEAGAAMFPWAQFAPFPTAGAVRNVYKASFHDITRFGVYKVDLGSGNVVGKIDVDEANNATDIELSADGRVAYVVDLMFHSFHIFNTARGQNGNPTTLFAAVSSNGPGGADPGVACIPEALRSVEGESRFRMSPQAQITPIDGYDPVDPSFATVNTGVEFDVAAYHAGTPQMKAVPDSIGSAPIGVRLSPDGQTVYVANYLARNVMPVATAAPLDPSGKPANLRCANQPTLACGNNNDCPAGAGFCNHPGGATCTTDADCGAAPPCIRSQDCVPLMLGQPVSTLTGGIAADALPPSVLDGKILFNTAGRDGSVSNNVGLNVAAPLFNKPGVDRVPGSVVSTAHDASYVTCSTCHADFGGQDGRTWDFSQFGASLRNTMDLRGRPGFSPGTCSNDSAKQCFFDAACGAGNTCKMNPQMIPPNVPAADRDRYFNPMLTVHWNGDRDEVEDFEHTYRSLLGAGDCDGIEFTQSCQGALIQRSANTSSDPADVNDDLGAPNRNIRGPLTGMNVGVRLSNMADFVYSLTEFPKNPNGVTPAVERGRRIFNDPATQCTTCHVGGPGAGQQFFTDKKPNFTGFDPNQPAGPDRNNPFVRHDVGTANLFDDTDPLAVAMENQTFQNPGNPPDRRTIPASRGRLSEYITPVLNDLWNTAPYLHDGSAHALLDVIRPCNPTLDDCLQPGRGHNLRGSSGTESHGATSFLTPQQLNDLVDFQNALNLSARVGTNERALNAGSMNIKRLVVTFPRTKKNGKKVGKGAILAIGTLSGGSLGGSGGSPGVVLSLAVPNGDRMAILEQTLESSNGRRFRGAAMGGGALSLAVKSKANGSTFMLKGKGLDLSTLDTGNRDVTIALEFGKTGDFAAAQFVQNRVVTGKKNILTLPKKSKKKHKA
jgi:hypothetical protein